MTNLIGQNIYSLEDKVCLLTGAASGLGNAMAKQFAALGAKLIISDINQLGCDELEQSLKKNGTECSSIECDLGNKQSIDSLIKSAYELYGNVDVLVCCGGMEGYVGSMSELADDDWDTLMTVNLKSAHWLSSAVAPKMAEKDFGRILFISSIAGLRGNKMIGLYGIAKAGLSQLARNLAVEWGPSGVTVNAIAPGLIETPFSEKLKIDQSFMDRRMSLTPLRRMGQPHEISGIAAMLASSAGGFVTGQTIVVDGGTLITDGN